MTIPNLSQTTLNRRNFIVATAVVGGGMALGLSPASAKNVTGAPWGGATAPQGAEFSPWVVIGADDTVTVRVTQPEIGNGVMTQGAMTVAEELGCAWSKVRTEFAPPNRNYREKNVYSAPGGPLGYFAGRSTGPGQMRNGLQVGASARERLKAAAARRWNVPVAEIKAAESVLTHTPSGRTLRYGEVAEQAATIQLAQEPALKPESEWTLLGKAAPGKLNNDVIVNGQALYGIDVRQPNMLYATLLQSPVQGGKLKSYDFNAIKAMPGVHSVVVVDPAEKPAGKPIPGGFPSGLSAPQSAIAVVADHYWQARRALDALPVQWDDGDGAQWKTTEQMEAAALAATAAAADPIKTVGDVAAAMARPDGFTVEATYITPYCEHATMEPLNGMALVTPDRVDVWMPSQHSQQVFNIAAEQTGVAPEKIHVHQTYVGGGFGRRVMGSDARMVIAIAQKVPGRPVKVIWSREETTRQGRYRALEAAKLTAKLDATGLPVALLARCSGKGHAPDGLSNTAWTSGPIPNVQVESKTLPFHILTGPYRGPGYNSNAFIVESFIDECAAAAKIDPIEYRLRILEKWDDPAWAQCLKVVRTESGWGSRLPKGKGRGVAISNWGMNGKPKAGTTAAVVARVAVSKAGELKVERLDLAFDCGKIANRDAVQTQLMGGTIFGLNMAMQEELTIENGRVVEGNFDTYPIVRMAEIPDIRIHFGGLSGHDRFYEVGEPPVGPVGPAIANAIFAATGKRIRRTPLLKQDLKWT